MKNASVLGAVASVLICGLSLAETPDECPWKFATGHWKHTDSAGNEAEVVWKEADGNSLIGLWKGDDGKATEIAGWRPDEKVLVATGYGPNGEYWEVKFTTVTANLVKGPMYQRDPKGVILKGTWTLTKKSDNEMPTRFEGTRDGKEVVIEGSFKRVVSPAGTAEETNVEQKLQVLAPMLGKWKFTAKHPETGEDLDAMLTVSWSFSNKMMIHQFQVQDPVASEWVEFMRQVYVWNHIKGRIEAYTTDAAEGIVAASVVTPKGDGVYVGKQLRATKKVESVTTKFILKDDSFTAEFTNRKDADGNALDDFTVTAKRVNESQ